MSDNSVEQEARLRVMKFRKNGGLALVVMGVRLREVFGGRQGGECGTAAIEVDAGAAVGAG